MKVQSQRWLGVAGIVFVVLLVASGAVSGNSLNAHSSLAKVVAHYHHKSGQLYANAFITEIAVLIGIGFFWFLREYLPVAQRSLANLGFVGALIFAMSGTVAAGLSWSLANAADHVDPTVMQGLNVLSQDFGNIMSGVGVALFFLATGVVVIRTAALPVWLGWMAVVLGVASLVIFFVGFFGIGLWILIVSVVILLRSRSTAAKAAP